jgi:hypothetical protein
LMFMNSCIGSKNRIFEVGKKKSKICSIQNFSKYR